jgi:hypothetical protein
MCVCVRVCVRAHAHGQVAQERLAKFAARPGASATGFVGLVFLPDSPDGSQQVQVYRI